MALLMAMTLSSIGLVLLALGHAEADDAVDRAVETEIAEFRNFERNAKDPDTGQPYAAAPRVLEGFLASNVTDTSQLLVGIWQDRIQIASASDRSEVLDRQVVEQALTSGIEAGETSVVRTDEYGVIRVDVLPVRDGALEGALGLLYFVDDQSDPLNGTMRTYTLVAVTALLLITVIGAWSAGRLLSPLRTLQSTAREIGDTDLSRRIPEVGNDDVTDLTRTFNAMLDRLDRAFHSQRAFLDDASHELRTPLMVIRGHTELMEQLEADEFEVSRAVVLEEVDRMARLVNDLLMLTKSERPDFLELAEVDVDELIKDVVLRCEGMADRSWSNAAATGETVIADRQRLVQALLQLAENARKHTIEGQRITVGASASGANVTLFVEDEGPGITDVAKQTVFDRFRQADNSGRTEGLGLGLSIVAAITRAHGGSVHVEDHQPHGTRMLLTLPRSAHGDSRGTIRPR